VGLRACAGCDAIWGVVDRLSKMRHCIPCLPTIDAPGLAEWVLREVVSLDGVHHSSAGYPGELASVG